MRQRQRPRKPGEQVFWPKVVLKKLLNISGKDSDFSADEGDHESEFEDEEACDWERRKERPAVGQPTGTIGDHLESISYKLRRRNSETFRQQYINNQELRICIGTWNVGGRLPPDDLDITEWLKMEEPADIYALGFQEIVPLNAGNVFGAEDSRPVPKWERIVRETLNRKIQPAKPRYKCFSDPPSPSRFNPSENAVSTAHELLPDTDTDSDEDEGDEYNTTSNSSQQKGFTEKHLDRLNHFRLGDDQIDSETTSNDRVQDNKMLLRMLSRSERIGLIWPEQPLDLLAKQALDTNQNAVRSAKSFRNCKSLNVAHAKYQNLARGLLPDLGLDVFGYRKKRSPFVRIISKQMVGIFLSIWVRRSLRRNIQNLKVSTVGVGAMGYIGNKGSVAVSMSIYQNLFCFVCSHLSSGEKAGDATRRNADVHEIHRRTLFSASSRAELSKSIYDHERIFWLGDLNYRIDWSSEKTHNLIAAKDWSTLAEKDQLKSELKKGQTFDGWTEGIMKFPPTYKYEFDSNQYIGDDHKGGKRSPAWCDRVLSFGKGVRLLDYRRTELKLSDHRPVTAIFTAEVEVFCHRKLQRALTLTDAEIEGGGIMPDLDSAFTANHI